MNTRGGKRGCAAVRHVWQTDGVATGVLVPRDLGPAGVAPFDGDSHVNSKEGSVAGLPRHLFPLWPCSWPQSIIPSSDAAQSFDSSAQRLKWVRAHAAEVVFAGMVGATLAHISAVGEITFEVEGPEVEPWDLVPHPRFRCEKKKRNKQGARVMLCSTTAAAVSSGVARYTSRSQ
jgi:hypothetical protein